MTDEHKMRCECARIAMEFALRRIPSDISTEGAMRIFAKYAGDDIQLSCLELSAVECKAMGILDSDLVIARALEVEAFVRYEEPVVEVPRKQRGRKKENR